MDGLPDFSEGRARLTADPSVLKYVHLFYGGLISGVKKIHCDDFLEFTNGQTVIWKRVLKTHFSAEQRSQLKSNEHETAGKKAARGIWLKTIQTNVNQAKKHCFFFLPG